MPFATANAELEKHFVVVHWDQRGAGKSFDSTIPPDSMRVAQLVSDAEELVNLLRDRFAQEQIFLAAHSTGSVLGVLRVQRDPQLFRAYVGISQVANLQMTETFLYNLATSAAEKEGNDEARDELRKIGAPPVATAKELHVSQKWVNHFAPDKFGAVIDSVSLSRRPITACSTSSGRFAAQSSLSIIYGASSSPSICSS